MRNQIDLDGKLYRLALLPLLQGLPPRHLDRVAQWCTLVVVPPGTLLLAEGRPASQFVFVDVGDAVVTQGRNEVATVGSGACLGHLSLLTGEHQKVTVTSTSDMKVFVSSPQEFQALLADPVVGPRLVSSALAGLQQPVVRQPAVVGLPAALTA